MQVTVGAKLGPYAVTSFLGKGGMGEVYLGTDTRLGRPVAIKLSSHGFSDRFEREARAISSLNHPNICTLYDVGPNYLVMEFVEGETLEKLIDRGPLPLDKALTYAVQIVDALAAAHAKGIVHRDLKPGNIIISKNGVKVLDFGLAKLSSERSPEGPADAVETVPSPITRRGAILGTLYYMSPEQVEGKEADERSDIFSFGVILHEMITGQRPFTGDTQAAVLASVLKDQPPPMHARQPATPRALERLVRKCLEKKPDDRWQSSRDLKPALELIDLDALPSSASTSASAHIPRQNATRTKWLWWTAGVAALVALTAVAVALWPRPQPPARVTRFEVGIPSEAEVAPGDFYLRISPDGTKVAFTSVGSKGGIWIRDLESIQARVLPGTTGALAPFWSPDSKSLAYGLGTRLMRVDISGGPPQVVCESPTAAGVGSGFWTDDGQIVFGHRGGGPLEKVSASGGIPTAVTALGEDVGFHGLPSLLPDGRHFLYSRFGRLPSSGIFVGSLDEKPDHQSLKQVATAEFGATFAQARNAAGGVLFFVRDGVLMAQPFDVKALSLAGAPVPVVQQIGLGRSHAHFSVTSSGVMAYRTGAGANTQLAWVDRTGNIAERVGDSGRIVSLSLSPDEKQVAIVRGETNGSNAMDIWLLDLARNVETRVTTGGADVSFFNGPIWSPDSKEVAYGFQGGIYVKDVGGASGARLLKKLGQSVSVTDWTRDGKFLIYSGIGRSLSGIFAISVQGGDPVSVGATDGLSALATISPDSRWLAYTSDRSGQPEVYVRPFAPPGSGTAPSGPVLQISANGGVAPKWRDDGRELLFVGGLINATRGSSGTLMSVSIDTSKGVLHPSAPVALGIRMGDGGWSPNRSGQKFLLAPPVDLGARTPITIVTNWEATLKPH